MIQITLILIITLSGMASLTLRRRLLVELLLVERTRRRGSSVSLWMLLASALIVIGLILGLAIPRYRKIIKEAVPRYRAMIRDQRPRGRRSPCGSSAIPTKLTMLFGGNLSRR